MKAVKRAWCFVRGHRPFFLDELTPQVALFVCLRCEGEFVYKHSGEYAGAVLPFDDDARRHYKRPRMEATK